MNTKEGVITLAQCSFATLLFEKKIYCTLCALLCAIRALDYRKDEDKSITSLNTLAFFTCLFANKYPIMKVASVIVIAIASDNITTILRKRERDSSPDTRGAGI